MEMEFQPIEKLKQTLENNEMSEEEEFNKEWIKLTMLVDCGQFSTIVGIESFKQILDQYTALTRTGLEYSQSSLAVDAGHTVWQASQFTCWTKIGNPIHFEYVQKSSINPEYLFHWAEKTLQAWVACWIMKTTP